MAKNKKNAQTAIIYQCSLCSYQTHLRHKLKRHFSSCINALPSYRARTSRNVTSGAKFKCEFCVFEGTMLESLLKHKESHASLIDSGLIKCSHCSLQFFTLEECKRHMEYASLQSSDKHGDEALNYVKTSSNLLKESAGPIKVEDCSNEAISNDELMESTRINQDALNSEQQKTPKEREKLTIVFDNFVGELVKVNGLYSCPCENFQTKFRSNYLRHLKLIHNAKANRNQGMLPIEALDVDENSMSCLICFRKAESQLQLVVHTALDHAKDGSPFACPKPECRFEAHLRDEIIVHLTEVHRLEENNFRPLAKVPQPDQSPFACSICFLENENDFFLKAHTIVSHLKNTDGPFECPWPECDSLVSSKYSFRRHIKGTHGIILEDHGCRELNQTWDAEKRLLSCHNCGHQSQTDLQMKIHRRFYHHPKDQKVFACPTPQCFFSTIYKQHLKRHLKRVHKLGDEHFRDYGNLDATNESEANDVVTVEVIEDDSDDVGGIDSEEEEKATSLLSSRKRHNCQYCDFTTTHHNSLWRHQNRHHRKVKCDLCNANVRGKYQVFWHNYTVHGDSSEIARWTLRCNLCGYWGLTNDSYKHGATHELSEVFFRTFCRKIPSGFVTFQYEENELKELDIVEGPAGDGKGAEDCVAPSAVKVLDWTMSDEEGTVENTLAQLATEEAITIMFADSDNEAQTKNDDDDPQPNTNTDDLLIMKSEFLTCKECSYETQDASLLKAHKLLMHATWTTENRAQYLCCEDSCIFESKYKSNFRRHLMNTHKYKERDLWVADGNQSEKTTEGRRKKLEVYREMQPDDDHRDPSSKNLDPDHRYSKRKHQCPERNCVFTTDKVSELSSHRQQTHSVVNTFKPKYVCPNLHCLFDTDKKHTLKKHLEVFHKIEEDKVLEMEEAILAMKTFACSKCDFQAKDSNELKKHYLTSHGTKELRLSPAQKDLQELCLKCTTCKYETSRVKAARRHGSQHYRWNQMATTTFQKYFNNKRQGTVKFRYASRNSLPQNAGKFSQGRLHSTNQARKIRKKQLGIKNKKQAAKLVALDREAIKSESPIVLATDNLVNDKKIVMARRETRNSKMKKAISEKLQEVDYDSHSAGDKEAGTYSLEELHQIIGVSSGIQTTTKPTTIESDWIAALEEDMLSCDDFKNTEENEVIRIEVTEDSDEENISSEPLDRSLNSDNPKSKTAFCCHLCQTEMPDKKSLQMHIINKHFIDDIEPQRPEEPKKKMAKKPPSKPLEAIPGRVSYKCWMCGENFFNKKTLENHTYIHAREDDNFDLKVSYSMYKGDTKVDTVVIQADPNYKPRPSHNVSLFTNPRKRQRTVRSPALEYDPSLTVFSCTECNFKTNLETDLSKHKNLHWTADKEEAFKTRKWFTCGVCFFHCFDVAKFKEHGEKHRAAVPGSTKIDVKKIGKNSWSF